jgi:hypothetical protein
MSQSPTELPSELRNVSFDHDHNSPDPSTYISNVDQSEIHHVVVPSFDDHDNSTGLKTPTKRSPSSSSSSSAQLVEDQDRSPEQHLGREENDEKRCPPPSHALCQANNDRMKLALSRHETILSDDQFSEQLNHQHYHERFPYNDVSTKSNRSNDCSDSHHQRNRSEVTSKNKVELFKAINNASHPTYDNRVGLDILSSAVVAGNVTIKKVDKNIIEERQRQSFIRNQMNILEQQRLYARDMTTHRGIQYSHHFSGSNHPPHPVGSHYQHLHHPSLIKGNMSRTVPPPSLPVLNQDRHPHIRHPSLRPPPPPQHYQSQHGYYGHYRHSSFPPTQTPSYLPIPYGSHNFFHHHHHPMHEQTAPHHHQDNIELPIQSQNKQDEKMKVVQSLDEPERSKKSRHSKSEIGNGYSSTKTSNRSSQTFVTAMGNGQKTNTMRSNDDWKHVATNTEEYLSNEGVQITPSNLRMDKRHHRKNSSLSSIGLGNILGGPVLSPGDIKETPPSSHQKQLHPLKSSPPTSIHTKQQDISRHHRSTSSSSFFNVLDSIVGRDNEMFLRHLHREGGRGQQSSSTHRNDEEDDEDHSIGLSPMSTTDTHRPPLESIRCKIQYDDSDHHSDDNIEQGKLAAGGTSKRVRRKCTIYGCQNRVVQGGLCITHGARRKICQHPGCMKHVKKAGYCSTHGPARKRCDVLGCHKVAVQKNRCVAHGAKKKLCNYRAGCTKQAILGGQCKKHHDIQQKKKMLQHNMNGVTTSPSSSPTIFCSEIQELETIDTIAL